MKLLGKFLFENYIYKGFTETWKVARDYHFLFFPFFLSSFLFSSTFTMAKGLDPLETAWLASSCSMFDLIAFSKDYKKERNVKI